MTPDPQSPSPIDAHAASNGAGRAAGRAAGRSLGVWLVAYGVFLVAVGVAGYLSNPEKAKTALASGGTFGGLSALWGVLVLRGVGWAPRAALVTTSLLSAVFVWRASMGWMAVAGGQAEKRTAAVLISLMLCASLATLIRLKAASRGADGPMGAVEGASDRWPWWCFWR